MSASRRKAIVRGALPYVAFAVVAIGVINFFWFMSETIPLQLIPQDSHELDGHFFMWSKNSGGYVELSRSFWEWVRFHSATVFLTWPLVMLAAGYLVFTRLSGIAAGQASPVVSPNRVRQVRDSGPLLASARSSGLIGHVWFSRPLLRIHVYPGGILAKPLFIAERAVLAGEITAVKLGGGLSAQSVPDKWPTLGFSVAEVSPSFRVRGPFVQIDHAGAGMASPLVISGSGIWDVAQEIRMLADASRGISPASGQASATEKTSMAPSGIEASTEPQTLIAQGARRENLPAVVKAGLAILGVIVSAALVWFGITWAIPQLGPFGLVWTAAVVLILAANVWRWARSGK